MAFTPFHHSLIRPNLILGCDREMIMISGIAAFASVLLWTLSLLLFRRMAKADPLLRFVYIRHRAYQAYYPPRSTPFRVNTREYR